MYRPERFARPEGGRGIARGNWSAELDWIAALLLAAWMNAAVHLFAT